MATVLNNESIDKHDHHFLFIIQEELLSLKTIPNSLAVFCLATYGEGDPTDNAMEFWEFIQGDVDLTGLNYTVRFPFVSFGCLLLNYIYVYGFIAQSTRRRFLQLEIK